MQNYSLSPLNIPVINIFSMENLPPTNNQGSATDQAAHTFIKNIKKPKLLVVALGVAAILIIITVLFTKGFFIAAVVNGQTISRWAVIKELEKQGGKEALESMIEKRVIDAELSKSAITIPSAEIDQEIKKIEKQVALQGGTLQDALAGQGLTEEKLRDQIILQKKIEKILADKVTVSPQEVDAYLKESKVVPPKEMSLEDLKKQISEQLQQQKFQQAAQKWLSDLRATAKIKYYTSY